MIEIKDFKRYLELVQRVLIRFPIDNPKSYRELIQIHRSSNGIEAWSIDKKRIKYHDKSFIDVNSERGVFQEHKDSYMIIDLHYHYEPNENGCSQLRFDFDNIEEGIHANPDPGLDMAHRIMPGDILLDFEEMNLYLMIELVTYYIQTKKYPLNDSFSGGYNEIVTRTRSEMENGS